MYSVLIAISRSDSPSVILPVTTMTLIRSSCWVSSSHNIPLLLLPTFLQNNNLVNWSTIAYQGWKTWIRLPVVRYCGPHLNKFFSLFNLTLLKLTFKMFVWQIIEGRSKMHSFPPYTLWGPTLLDNSYWQELDLSDLIYRIILAFLHYIKSATLNTFIVQHFSPGSWYNTTKCCQH